MFDKIKNNVFYFLYLYIFLTPLLFSMFYQRQREEDFVFCFISSLLFTLPLYLIREKKYYLILSSLIFVIAGTFDLTHIFLYKGRITSSIFFIILDTNPIESLEFISSNISVSLIFVIISYLLGFTLLLRYSIQVRKNFNKRGLNKTLLFWIFAPFIVKFLTSQFSIVKTVEAYTRSNQVFLMLDTYAEYNQQMKIFNTHFAKAKKITGVERKEKIDKDEIHVLVIWESVTRTHMEIYGYERKTTPRLQAQKDQLIVFNDVVNSHPPGTASNLKRINTLANRNREDAETLSVSLVGILKAAGFKTYWLSNQLILGAHDTITASLARQADVNYFTNTTNSITYDEKLLPLFKKKLEDKVKKKFIILHLFGSHMKYRNRSPENFKRFKNSDEIKKMPFHNERSLTYINEYDNSIYYTDYVLDNVLTLLKNRKEIITFMYISDHGEEVYENLDLHGHPSVKSKPVYEIPMIAWVSNNYKVDFSSEYAALMNNVNTPYAHDNLIHTLMDLYKIKSHHHDPKASLINKLFVPETRYYDSL